MTVGMPVSVSQQQVTKVKKVVLERFHAELYRIPQDQCNYVKMKMKKRRR